MMRRSAFVLLLAAGLACSESRRADLTLWLDSEPTGFDYTVVAPTGAQRSGSEAFDRALSARLGTRWTWSSPGRSWAPQYGVDLAFSQADGAALESSSYALALAAGIAWAPGDTWQIEFEAHAGGGRTDATAPAAVQSPAFSVSGTSTSMGLRTAASWRFTRHWAAGGGLGWLSESADLSGDTVDLTTERAGLVVALGLIWRLDVRPAELE